MLLENERFDVVNEQIKLIQKKNGLTFGTDAYLLSAYVRGNARERAVDLGSGTGIIPMLCISRSKAMHFHAIELQPSFADIINRNIEVNGFTDKIIPICADVKDITSADIGGEVGIVTANPPYMSVGSGARNDNDEKYFARHEICGSVFDFCATAARLLKHGGRFFCVFRPERLADLFSALRDVGLEPKRMTLVQATSLSRPSMVLVEAQKGAAPSMIVTPPLCLWLPDNNSPMRPSNTPSEDSDYIYSNCNFPPHFTLANKN